MSKKEKSAPKNAFSSLRWPVLEDVRLENEGQAIVSGRCTDETKELKNEQYQELMLKEFMNIRTPADAVKYVVEFSFPVEPYRDGTGIDNLPLQAGPISSSGSMWGCNAFLPVQEIIRSAAYLQRLWEIADQLRSDCPVLFQYLEIAPTADSKCMEYRMKRELAIVTESRRAHEWVRWNEVSQNHPIRVVSSEEWERKKQSLVIGEVMEYLTYSMDRLLHGVHPALAVEAGRFYPAFEFSTAWQAMCLALYREISGHGNVRKCARPSCNQFFIPKRIDKVACSNNCGLAVWRQKQKESQRG